MMPLGKTVAPETRALAINSPDHPINVSDGLSGDFEKLMIEKMHKARKTEAFLRAKRIYNKERGAN